MALDRIDARSADAPAAGCAALESAAIRTIPTCRSSVPPVPLCGRASRVAALLNVLRQLDVRLLTTAEVATICTDAVPDAAIVEIAAAIAQLDSERQAKGGAHE